MKNKKNNFVENKFRFFNKVFIFFLNKKKDSYFVLKKFIK